MDATPEVEIERLMELQHALEARTTELGASAADVLKVGSAVLEFAEREEAFFFPLLPLLDPAARAELGGEHEQLAEDLELLEWLVTTTPDSPDVGILADAIARRMRTHIARDGRLLAQAAKMAAR
ncbi:MAG TPA: hypothetical protein VF147_09700 [Vicinamibacterales bacterium]